MSSSEEKADEPTGTTTHSIHTRTDTRTLAQSIIERVRNVELIHDEAVAAALFYLMGQLPTETTTIPDEGSKIIMTYPVQQHVATPEVIMQPAMKYGSEEFRAELLAHFTAARNAAIAGLVPPQS